jgi:hypothetical protein
MIPDMARIALTAQLSPQRLALVRKFGQRVTKGVYVETVDGDMPFSLLNRARAALAVSPPGSMITGLSGLALAGATIPFELEPLLKGPVSVIVPVGAGRFPQRPEFKVSRLRHLPPEWPATSRPDLTLAHPVFSWAHTVLDLSKRAWWSPGQPAPGDQSALPGLFDVPGKREFLLSVQLGDAVVARREKAVLTMAEFQQFITEHGHQRWFAAARQVVDFVRAGTDSPKETWLRLTVVDLGFPEPQVNPEVWVRGRRLRLDLAWIAHLIDLEFQGSGHFLDPDRAKSDVYRRRDLETDNWTVVEVTGSDLYRPGGLAARLSAAFVAARHNAHPIPHR